MASHTAVFAQSDKFVQRDEQFWYKNGDIVLIASYKIAFKIYIEILSRESSVFRDIANQDVLRPEEQEMMDNCPVVHLTDEPDDLRIFLTLLYDGWRVRKDNTYRTWPFVKVMITLGDKYHTPEFYNAGIDMLKLAFLPWLDAEPDEHEDETIQFTPEDAISMANVTRNLDPDLHAVALYLCCLLPVETLASGLGRKGQGLRPQILYRCLQGREHFEMSRLNKIRRVLDVLPQVTGCLQTPGRCGDIVVQLRASDFPIMRARMHHTDSSPPYDLLKWSFWKHMLVEVHLAGVCDECLKYYTARGVKARQAIRHSLQRRFGLDQ